MKSAIAKYNLKKKLRNSSRDVKALSLDEINDCGVICEVNDKQALNLVNNYVKLLKQKGINNVDVLYVINEKDSKVMLNLPQENTLTIKTDTSWLNQPKKVKTQRFINKKFDLLLDIVIKPSTTVDYVVGLSKSRFKVGAKRTLDFELYDLEIDVRENPTLDYLCKQIIIFLEMIKSK